MWSPAARCHPPGWTEHPCRPRRPPRRARWFPVVTLVQETADLMAGFSAKTGYGHDYNDAFVNAWAAVAPPNGWDDALTARLADALAATN